MIPFSFVPGGLAAGTFAYFRMSKQAFASILCIISRKTKLVITLDDETEILLKRNDGGGFDSLELPDERFSASICGRLQTEIDVRLRSLRFESSKLPRLGVYMGALLLHESSWISRHHPQVDAQVE